MPDPGLADHGHEVRACPRAPRARRGCRARPSSWRRPTSGDSLAGETRRTECSAIRPTASHAGTRSALPFSSSGSSGCVLDGSVGRAHRALADGHAPGPRGALEPRGDVHGVADDGVGVAHRAGEHLAGVHAHAQREVGAVREAVVHLDHGGLHPEPGADGALGVVLVRHRRAEDRHHVVADVLVDGAAVALDLVAEAQQRAVHERLHRPRGPCARRRRCSRTGRRTAP